MIIIIICITLLVDLLHYRSIITLPVDLLHYRSIITLHVVADASIGGAPSLTSCSGGAATPVLARRR